MLIVIKEKGNVYIAVTANGAYSTISEADMLHEENLPLWRVEGVSRCMMATAGVSAFGYDLLRYGDFGLRAPLTQTNIITKFIPAIKERLAEYDQLDKKGQNWSGLIIAKGGKAFYLMTDFTYEEVEESRAIGRDSDVARGALLLTKGMSPHERIRRTCEVVEKGYKRKQFPVVVMTTKGEGVTVLYE